MAAHAFPVSVKGVAVQAGRVLLLGNERAEWELRPDGYKRSIGTWLAMPSGDAQTAPRRGEAE